MIQLGMELIRQFMTFLFRGYEYESIPVRRTIFIRCILELKACVLLRLIVLFTVKIVWF